MQKVSLGDVQVFGHVLHNAITQIDAHQVNYTC